MIPFFRRIRKKLADDNQFLKYSRYAIGEIVLVVLGILIALYINNWNENRISKKRLFDELVLLEKELVSNVKGLDWHIEERRKEDSIFRSILNNEYSKEDYKNNKDLREVMLDFVPAKLNTKSFDQLRNESDLKDAELESLLKDILFLYDANWVDTKILSQRRIDIAMEFENQLANSKSWYYEFMNHKHDSEDALSYFAEDPAYKNKAYLYYRIGVQKYVRGLQRCRSKALLSYKELHHYIQKTYLTHSEDLLFVYDPADFKHYIGSYKDSVSISRIYLDKDVLKYSYTPIGGESYVESIFPVNRRYFTTGFNDGFYYFVFDENGNVVALQEMGDVSIREYKKVE